ncbi:hypothetical protein GF386_02185 [Candidatus Pacearchaeota archaeon]|nr:hypothetical protein [Candidatus Pacearchaeota archaeon]MBD3282977.1 hypothetical protein [Candidatus Pacearchaeota archaeon]
MVWTNKEVCDNLGDSDLRALISYLRSGISPPRGRITQRGLMPVTGPRLSRGVSGAMPGLDEFDFDEKDSVYIYPEPNPGQLGLVGFDIRAGRIIVKSDTVMDNVGLNDLLEMNPTNLDEGESYVLHPNADGENVYYIVGFEGLGLSDSLELLIDSRSTTGRVGCMTHFAGVTPEGNLITAVQPYSFPVKITCGKTCLSQAAVRYRDSPFMTNDDIRDSGEISFFEEGSDLERKLSLANQGYLRRSLNSQGLKMKFKTSLVYRARPYHKDMAPIDMDGTNNLDPEEYFELIEGNSEIRADRKTLYLLGSQGIISLRKAFGILSREQGVITGTGAWSHLAGFIQPYWTGQITMEYYSHEVRRIINGSGAGFVRFDAIEGDCKEPEEEGSYQHQVAPALPKMFRKT